MKITKTQLKQIIKEELENVLEEGFTTHDPDDIPPKNLRAPRPSSEDIKARKQNDELTAEWLAAHKALAGAEDLYDEIGKYYYENDYTYPDDLVKDYAALFPKRLQNIAGRMATQQGH